MRKLLLLLCFVAFAAVSDAQMVITSRMELGRPYDYALSIPKEFSYDGKPLITMYDNSDEKNLLIYDENLNLVKQVDMTKSFSFDYSLTYQDEVRHVNNVKEVDKTQTSLNMPFEEWQSRQSMLDPSFTPSALTIQVQENGDSVITYKSNYTSYEYLYFAYNSFGVKYPKLYWLASKGNMYECKTNYEVEYSDWQVTNTYTQNKQKSLDRLRLCNINLNSGDGRANYYFIASQTLFNNDEDFEYIIPKYKLSKNSNVGGYPSDIYTGDKDESIDTVQTTCISEESNLYLAGFQVVSSEGNVISNIDFDAGEGVSSIDLDYAYVITIGSNTYLAFDGYDSNDKRATLFYKINRTTSDIKKVKVASNSMLVSSTAQEHNAIVNINFTDENNGGSIIVVTSANGVNIKQVAVPSNQKNVQFSFTGNAGVYCVSRIQKGKISEVKKVMIK